MHYYKRNIGDYAKKAGRLSMLEHGAYTLLLDACYDRERFPTLEEAIEWCWARSDDEEQAVKFVLSRFFDLKDGVYIQNRIAEEVAVYVKNAETNKRIATEREQKRTNRAQSVNEASQSVNEPPPNHKPITINQKPITNNQEPETTIQEPKNQEKKEEKEKEKKEKPQAASASRSSVSKPDDVSDQTWTDWIAHRKAKKATVTETVLKSIQAEADKAGMNLEAALETMCARGWSGFKAEWVQTAGQSTAKSQIIGKSMGSAADEIVGQIFGDVLDGDCFFVKDILEIEKNGNA